MSKKKGFFFQRHSLESFYVTCFDFNSIREKNPQKCAKMFEVGPTASTTTFPGIRFSVISLLIAKLIVRNR